MALAALAGYAAWTGASISWAPIRDAAANETAQAVLYAAAFGGALVAMRDPLARRWAAPALLAGITVVAVYALAGRLLPDLITTEVSNRAGSRLQQPLTYLERARPADGLRPAAGSVRVLRPGPLETAARRRGSGHGALRGGALPHLLARIAGGPGGRLRGAPPRPARARGSGIGTDRACRRCRAGCDPAALPRGAGPGAQCLGPDLTGRRARRDPGAGHGRRGRPRCGA